MSREILPIEGVSSKDLFNSLPSVIQKKVLIIREEKGNDIRTLPTGSLIDKSELLDKEKRNKLLNKVAKLVDENIFGRSEMCMQFACLLAKWLQHLGIKAKYEDWNCEYFNNWKKIFEWNHAWVRVWKEIIDWNIDSSIENPLFPENLKIQSYWWPMNQAPSDRRFHKNHNCDFNDTDIEKHWWPDLKKWLNENFL